MDWRAALIDAPTQAGKTWKCFGFLTHKLSLLAHGDRSLVVFVTQANCVAGTQQVIGRAQKDDALNALVAPSRIMRASDAVEGGLKVVGSEGHCMVVDFWNKRNTDAILRLANNTRDLWSSCILVFDEADYGGIVGVRSKLDFVRAFEGAMHPQCTIRIILVTATVAALSKSILRIASKDLERFRDGLVSHLVHGEVVEHHFAKPYETYVGPRWFMSASLWQRLELNYTKGMTGADKRQSKEVAVLNALAGLDDKAKTLCLVVTSTLTDDHAILANSMLHCGFNVAVELNGTNNKDYRVHFLSETGVATWTIPYKALDTLATKGSLSKLRVNNAYEDTGIDSKEDLALPLVLQAALFMGTEAEARIREHVADQDFVKLVATANAILAGMSCALRRPASYPCNPRVALVAGHLAGRGITIQSPRLDFVCTAFCFTDNKDTAYRGAANSQRFGRACGMLSEIYTTPGRQPVLIATEGIMADAMANEDVVCDKAAEVLDGVLVRLQDLVGQIEWEDAIDKVRAELQEAKEDDNNTSGGLRTPAARRLLLEYWNMSQQGTKSLTLREINRCPVCAAINEKDHRRTHNELIQIGLLVKATRQSVAFTSTGIVQAGELTGV
jgi:hypothetical protein